MSITSTAQQTAKIAQQIAEQNQPQQQTINIIIDVIINSNYTEYINFIQDLKIIEQSTEENINLYIILKYYQNTLLNLSSNNFNALKYTLIQWNKNENLLFTNEVILTADKNLIYHLFNILTSPIKKNKNLNSVLMNNRYVLNFLYKIFGCSLIDNINLSLHNSPTSEYIFNYFYNVDTLKNINIHPLFKFDIIKFITYLLHHNEELEQKNYLSITYYNLIVERGTKDFFIIPSVQDKYFFRHQLNVEKLFNLIRMNPSKTNFNLMKNNLYYPIQNDIYEELNETCFLCCDATNKIKFKKNLCIINKCNEFQNCCSFCVSSCVHCPFCRGIKEKDPNFNVRLTMKYKKFTYISNDIQIYTNPNLKKDYYIIFYDKNTKQTSIFENYFTVYDCLTIKKIDDIIKEYAQDLDENIIYWNSNYLYHNILQYTCYNLYDILDEDIFSTICETLQQKNNGGEKLIDLLKINRMHKKIEIINQLISFDGIENLNIISGEYFDTMNNDIYLICDDNIFKTLNKEEIDEYIKDNINIEDIYLLSTTHYFQNSCLIKI
jgi:hypothetical protein